MFLKRFTPVLLISVLWAASFSFANGETTFQPVTADPLIGPRDVLEIQVYNEEALSMTVVVSASNEFPFPLLRRVTTQGMTAYQLGRRMEARLLQERFLKDPTVTVTIKEQKFASAVLSGAIKTPGVVPLYPGVKLRKLIARQGGILDEEAAPYIHIQRVTGEQIKINRRELERTSTVDDADRLNLLIQPGDQIIIPRADFFYVLGAVNEPGGFPLTRKTRLGEAMGKAGGRKETGGNVLLWHHFDEDNQPKLITFTYDQYQHDPIVRGSLMSPGDSLYLTQNDSVFIGGEVTTPGMYSWMPEMTLLSGILSAGDRTFVGGNTLYLIRSNAQGKQVKSKYKYSDIRRDKKKNIRLLPGDIIHVSSNLLLDIPFTLRKINPFTLTVDAFSGPGL